MYTFILHTTMPSAPLHTHACPCVRIRSPACPCIPHAPLVLCRPTPKSLKWSAYGHVEKAREVEGRRKAPMTDCPYAHMSLQPRFPNSRITCATTLCMYVCVYIYIYKHTFAYISRCLHAYTRTQSMWYALRVHAIRGTWLLRLQRTSFASRACRSVFASRGSGTSEVGRPLAARKSAVPWRLRRLAKARRRLGKRAKTHQAARPDAFVYVLDSSRLLYEEFTGLAETRLAQNTLNYHNTAKHTLY